MKKFIKYSIAISLLLFIVSFVSYVPLRLYHFHFYNNHPILANSVDSLQGTTLEWVDISIGLISFCILSLLLIIQWFFENHQDK